jgi:hypothetical protein
MDQSLQFQVWVQPNPERHLNNGGVVVSTLSLTPDQFYGIMRMSSTIFDGYPEFHLTLTRLGLGQPFRFPARDPYYVTILTSSVNNALRLGEPWREAIRHTGLSGLLSPPVTMRYTALFGNYIPSVPRSHGAQTTWTIVQFDSIEFLQGAITACQWFGLNPREYIKEIHDGNTLMDIANI